MKYISVHIQITPFSEEAAEIVEAQISDCGFDSFTIEEPLLNAFIPEKDFSLEGFKKSFSNVLCVGSSLEYEVEEIAEQNWNSIWESDFKPVVIGRKCTIKAPYHKGLPRSRYNVTINPRMSFGSGHHQTTSMIVETMIDDKDEIDGKKVLDMGCGTGILAIMAAKLGAEAPVDAIDIDNICAESSVENARRNRVGSKINVFCGDAALIKAHRYDVIFANINRNILLADMEKYNRGLRKGGVIYMSGFFTEDIQMLNEKASGLGFKLVFKTSRDNWSLIKLKKE